jgi:hypothetical protein
MNRSAQVPDYNATVPAAALISALADSKALLKGLHPEKFSGRFRDHRAADWLVHFERFCKVSKIDAIGQDRIDLAGLLMTDVASQWFDQLGDITDSIIDGKQLSAYEVFKYKFRQRFVNLNDAEDAYDQMRALRQTRSVNEYVILFEKLRARLNNFDNEQAVRHFRSGLKPELHKFVDNHPEIADDDLHGLIALAERLDKMNKNERPFSHNHRKQNFSSSGYVKEETFPQPMDLDSVRAHEGTQSKFQRPMSKDDVKKNDFANELCFYCHKPGHMINACPARNRNRKSSNSKAH